MAELTYNVKEAAQVLGVSTDIIYDLCSRSELPHRRLGRRIVIPKIALEEWLRKAADEVKPVEQKPAQKLQPEPANQVVIPNKKYWQTRPGCGGRKKRLAVQA